MSILEYAKMSEIVQTSSCADADAFLKHGKIDYHDTIPLHEIANKTYRQLPPAVQYSFDQAAAEGWVVPRELCEKGQENRVLPVLMAAGLLQECAQGNYKLIENISELFPVDRERIIAYSKNRLALALQAKDSYYNDYINVLREDMEENEEIFKAILRLLKRTNVSKDNKFLLYVMNPLAFYKSVKPAQGDTLAEARLITMYSVMSWARAMTIDSFNDYESNPDNICFSEGDSVFSSKQYQRFRERGTEELADYVKKLYNDDTVTTDNVCDKIATRISLLRMPKSGQKAGNIDTQMQYYKIFCSMLQEYFGDANWLRLSLNPEGKPDVEKYLDDYFLQYVKTVCGARMVSKVVFMREYVPTPSEIYNGIILLYHSDMYMRLYRKLQEKYYREFSWEQITHKSMADRYQSHVADLQEELSEKDNEIESLKKRNLDLSDANRLLSVKSGSVDFHELEEIAQRKDKEIEVQNKRIAELERKLKQSEMLLTKLQTEESEDAEVPIDFDLLKSKRYLFVGKISESHPDLKRQFPNSLFFDNEGYDLKNIEVDAIVIFIKHVSHGMFYKLQNEARLFDVTRVYINTKNINTVYNQMQLALEIK